MVDPNPVRGMPLPLQRYWLVGKGGIKIRWNTPGDFLRCVRALTKYFPKDPKGLCNILHTKATGGPPGHGSLEHSTEFGLTAAAALLSKQPQLGNQLWAGQLAPINRPTGEPRRKRIFEPGSIQHRNLPLPLAYRKVAGDGHQGAVTVGRIMGITTGPDHQGNDAVWAWGDYLDPAIVPEVNEAHYMVDKGMVAPSLDPGGPVRVSINPESGAEHTTQYTIGGATLLSIPAFPGMQFYNLTPEGDWPNEDDLDMEMSTMEDPQGGCGCHGMSTDFQTDDVYVINAGGWQGLPLAPREAVFDNDEAIKRIAAWAQVAPQGTDVAKLHQAFLWQDSSKPVTDPTSYRMPLGDIINGKLTLVYHAIYAAAALLSGAHGGLPDIPEPEKAHLRNVITNIYQEMAKSFNDATMRAPWDRPVAEGQFAVDPNMPYGDVKYADPGYQKDKKKRYPLDDEAHVRAAWDYINQADNASQYDPKQLKMVRARIIAAAKKLGISISESAAPSMTASAEYAMVANGYPIDPPLSWFGNPKLGAKTPLTVTPDGRVYGHLAAWGECHRDVTNRECVLAPKSRKDYAPFHLGQVYTAEGEAVPVGKVVMDTRHADIGLGYASAALHYDNTGDEVAVVRAGEDQFGIWVAGAVVPEATSAKVAKLRRSPLSGDWRRVEGNLELCAALAVNVPAFPVYAMDGEDQMALVAAGAVYPEAINEPPTGIVAGTVDVASIVSAVKDSFAADKAQEDRAWRLRELVEEGDHEQDSRMSRLADIYAADD